MKNPLNHHKLSLSHHFPMVFWLATAVHPTFKGSPVMAMAAGFSCNKSACEEENADDTPRLGRENTRPLMI